MLDSGLQCLCRSNPLGDVAACPKHTLLTFDFHSNPVVLGK